MALPQIITVLSLLFAGTTVSAGKVNCTGAECSISNCPGKMCQLICPGVCTLTCPDSTNECHLMCKDKACDFMCDPDDCKMDCPGGTCNGIKSSTTKTPTSVSASMKPAIQVGASVGLFLMLTFIALV